MDKWKFVVIGDYRTGTNILVDWLKAQKDANVFCFHEIFNKNFYTNLQLSPQEILKAHHEKQFYLPKEFLGFKIMYDQIIDLKQNNFCLYQWIKDNNIKVIVVKRNNLFLQYLSYLTAYKTGIWRLSSDQERPPEERLTLSSNEYFEYKKICKQQYNLNISKLKEFGIKYIEVEYETFIKDSENDIKRIIFSITNKIFPIKNVTELKVHSKKQNVVSLSEKIQNWEVISKEIKETDFLF